ncbi:glycosyltransferase family 4 protein [Desulfuromonas sp. AOP6]|uniref:glycosyltransferase family 4 protein n=1 Tax=Desulfuromonas sp. AOP6 TaxID=1566351 RepID=UPI00126D2177|nr:glycosyltransferase family 4 protein [Desulfuromonas sp. AOP6]BCA80109.1 hypothetical protein AOP6_1896 [Desulfuromonas sp. AOP6]
MKKIRVLCLTSFSDLPEAHMFIKLKEAGIDLHVIASPGAPHNDTIRKAGVPLEEIKLKGRFDLHGIRYIRNKLKREPFDILHMFNNRTTSNGLLAATGIPIKIICYRGIEGNVSYLDPASWTTYLHPKVDRIICVAEAIRKTLLKVGIGPLRLTPEKVVTIHKGHELAWYNATPADLTVLDIPKDAFVIGCIANDRPRKGLHILIEAMNYLPTDGSVHLLLIGKMDSSKLLPLIGSSPNAKNIHLTGFRTDAPALIAACSTAVLPALKREGLPKAIIEAMVYAIPPIVTRSGGSPELVVENESGLVVSPGNPKELAGAIRSLYDNRALAKKMGEAARNRIRLDFRHATTVGKTLEVYQQLLES